MAVSPYTSHPNYIFKASIIESGLFDAWHRIRTTGLEHGGAPITRMLGIGIRGVQTDHFSSGREKPVAYSGPPLRLKLNDALIHLYED